MANDGLEGVVASSTELSDVDGERGELLIAGYRVDELAGNATFEETTWLLSHGELPSATELETCRGQLAVARELPGTMLSVLRECARQRLDPMDALRMAAGTLSLVTDDAIGIVARLPTIVAAYSRLRDGKEPLLPRTDLAHAANFLYMLSGGVPDAERVRALETYLNTAVDHGLNASTFTARIITSTGSDLVSAIVGALGALKGPLHGGALGPALDMVFEIGEASRAESFLRRKIEAGDKLMGFGHRIYKVRDARADVLAKAAERMFTRGGGCRPMWSSTRHSSYTGSVSGQSCSRRLLRSAASADGLRTRSSNGAATASSDRSRSMSVRAAGVGSRSANGRELCQRRPAASADSCHVWAAIHAIHGRPDARRRPTLVGSLRFTNPSAGVRPTLDELAHPQRGDSRPRGQRFFDANRRGDVVAVVGRA